MGEWFQEQAAAGSLGLAVPVAAIAGLVSFFSPCVLPLLPVRTLAPAFPVPLIALPPVRLRFSSSAPSDQVTAAWTVSVPAAAPSVTTSVVTLTT